MTAKLFIHGVPDSPAIWRPLLAALELGDTPVAVPALPGFTAPLPESFAATKEAYADWAIGQAETLVAAHGPIDIVGHDWGALIAQRVAMLRPDLIRSWAISNAVIEPDYRGHRIARIWNTPILGEIFMALSRADKLADGLAAQGMPADIAREEAEQWKSRDKRRAILKLYRSAKGLSFAHDWALDIPKLPVKRYADLGRGRSLCRAVGCPALHREHGHAADGDRRGGALGDRRTPGRSCCGAPRLLERAVEPA